jgi:predicted glycoside hydrolase/deacetylase ChbG (UPF0249 family)
MASVAERLGAGPDARLLILNCADLGFCHASSTGVYAALRSGLATSASLLVPAPWAREAAARFRGDDVGVRLTLNAEHDLYRWGPITLAGTVKDRSAKRTPSSAAKRRTGKPTVGSTATEASPVP